MGAGIEVELKLRAETDTPLATLASAHTLGPARLGPAATVEEIDRYLDTADRRLAAAGWACRLRTRGDVTVISLKGAPRHEPGATLHRRPELEGPAGLGSDPARWPASPAQQLAERLAGGLPLQERLVMEQRRTERDVEADGTLIGTLSLDRVRFLHEGHRLGSLRVVELELRGPVPAATVAALERSLAAVEGLAPDPLTKLEHALALLGEEA
jgi:inorganic triphosphatase YgiF